MLPQAKAAHRKASTQPRWRGFFVIVSSMCLSGLALVLWNRKALSRIRGTRAAVPCDATGKDEFI